MSWVVFERGGQRLAEVEAMPGDLLIDVARYHEVPLHWRCGQGTCGTCAVRVQHAAQPRAVPVGRKERNVLLRAGLCDEAAAACDTWLDSPATMRLACHLMLDETPWCVSLPED